MCYRVESSAILLPEARLFNMSSPSPAVSEGPVEILVKAAERRCSRDHLFGEKNSSGSLLLEVCGCEARRWR